TRRFSIENGFFVVPFEVILFSVGSRVRQPDPTPLLPPHYRALNARTDRSAPVSCIGTLASRLAPLALLPWHQEPGSCSSTQKPVSDWRPLYAGRRPRRHQASGRLLR